MVQFACSAARAKPDTHRQSALVQCHVDKQGQMREMDNRDQIDVPQALQWPAKLGGILEECVLSLSNLRTARG